MHKRLLLICLTLLLVGCTRIDDIDDYVVLVNECLVDKVTTNDVSLGYKYYVPKGVYKIHDYDFNQVFLVDNVSIYLYVDVISYYYQKELKYEKNDKAFYYQEIHHNDKNGYIEISEEDCGYFVQMAYHYSKIEVYTDKNNLNKIITLSSIILNSVNYNDTVIERVLQGDFGEFSELNYELEKPIGASNNFSQFLEEYVQKDDNEEKEEQLPGE